MSENEKKKEFLKEYKSICMKMMSTNEQLDSLREEMKDARCQSYSDMTKSNKKFDYSDLMVKIENLEDKIEKTNLERLDKKIVIEQCVADMEDGIECEVIRKRYLEFRNWEEVSEEMGYSWRHIQRIHSSAISNFRMS